MRYWIFLILALTISFHGVLAADSTFRVRTLIGGDTIPPTTPTNLAALPISTTQIDLSWDPSTDNFSFGGYQVWRDSLQIATTTLTNYSDTGLTASTTYSYYLVAFDTALNYSSSSLVVSTTTLPVIATTTPTSTPPTSNGPQSSRSKLEIKNLKIDTTETTADISFDSGAYSKVTWRWGRTINYEAGYVASDIYRQSHQTLLTELEPGTVYELEIILTRRITGENYIERFKFETKSPVDSNAPSNVTNLRAVLLENGEVNLNWNNPDIEDLSYIRVLSNDYFYPLDPTNGWLVYEGQNEAVVDKRQFESLRFYTVYVFDAAGNRSSGAVVYLSSDGVLDEPVAETDLPYDPYGNFVFSDLEVYQHQQLLPDFNGTVTIERQSETIFRIPYNRLPENLKTVILTLNDPTDKNKKFSFLLGINADGSAYEAAIGELPIYGYYETSINIYDYSTRVVARRLGGIVVSDGYFEDKATKVIEDIRLLVNWPLIFGLIIIGSSLLGFIFWHYYKRR